MGGQCRGQYLTCRARTHELPLIVNEWQQMETRTASALVPIFKYSRAGNDIFSSHSHRPFRSWADNLHNIVAIKYFLSLVKWIVAKKWWTLFSNCNNELSIQSLVKTRWRRVSEWNTHQEILNEYTAYSPQSGQVCWGELNSNCSRQQFFSRHSAQRCWPRLE
jgi:hypothetical protein